MPLVFSFNIIIDTSNVKHIQITIYLTELAPYKNYMLYVSSSVIFFVILAFLCTTLSSLPFTEATTTAGGATQDENRFINLAIRNITLIADDDTITRVAPDNQLHPGGIKYKTMTFNGTVPGPVLEFYEGELVRFILINNGDIVHSLNLHGITGPSQALSGPVKPGENKTWLVKVNPKAPSVFMYHCDGDNLNGVWEHVASGMYGGMIVTPSILYNQQNQTAKEFTIIFSEVYNSADKGLFKGTNGVIGSFDLDKFVEGKPDLVLTNGMAYKYIPWIGTIGKYILNNESESFKVKSNEPIRWNIINAGPRKTINFNFAAAMLDMIYPSSLNHSTSENTKLDNYANSTNEINSPPGGSNMIGGGQTYLVSIPPGSGVIVKTIFPEEGFYFGNDHDLASLIYGSGFVVSAVDNTTSVRSN
jgi:nitrite reductase (NO-forming)